MSFLFGIAITELNDGSECTSLRPVVSVYEEKINFVPRGRVPFSPTSQSERYMESDLSTEDNVSSDEQALGRL